MTPARAGGLSALIAAALALGLSGLLPPVVCALSTILIVVAGLVLPRRFPELIERSDRRTVVATLALILVVAATAATGSGALGSGGSSGSSGLGNAAGELALPHSVPLGLLAALAAGALVSVSLELADRRGIQSALVLGVAVLSLASVAAPGRHLIPVLVLGWPAALFTLTRLAAVPPRTFGSHRSGSQAATLAMRRADPTGGTAAGWRRHQLRWVLAPVLVAVTLSVLALTVVVRTGVAAAGARAGGWDAATRPGDRSGSERSTSDYLGGDLDLRVRGRLPTDPLLKVPEGSPRLWRAGTLDLYTGHGWLATLPAEGLPGLSTPAAGVLDLRPAAGSDLVQAGITRTDRVVPLRRGATQILAPGRLLSVSSATRRDGQVIQGAGDRLTLIDQPGAAGEYRVRAQVLPDVDDPAAAGLLAPVTTTEVDAAADRRWTVLPASVPERVRRLGLGLVAANSSRSAAVRAVERELARRMTYTLDSPVPAAGADAVDDVLFVSHTGFCEQFASAEVVLLRAAGIPARVAVGFAGSEPGSGGLRTERRSDAHAWAEVWFPGVGWVTSDPTPPAAASQNRWHSVRDALTGPLGWFAGAGLIVVLALLLRLRAKRRDDRLQTGDDELAGRRLDPELARAFAALEVALTAQQRGRAPNETLTALVRRLTTNPAGDVGTGLESAFAVLERALYAPVPPSARECREAARALSDFSAAEAPGSHP